MREPPTTGKQLLNCITCGCESSTPFFIITKPGANPRHIGDRLVWVVKSNDLTHWATPLPPSSVNFSYLKLYWSIEPKLYKHDLKLSAKTNCNIAGMMNGKYFTNFPKLMLIRHSALPPDAIIRWDKHHKETYKNKTKQKHLKLKLGQYTNSHKNR